MCGQSFCPEILIDSGSLVNIILLETLYKMNILDCEIVLRALILVGFNGETKNTIGEIKFPLYIEGVNSFQHFRFFDFLSCYNIIFRRPWIHNIDVVPSTYHKCVKIPTPWRVVKINSNQKEAKNFYTPTMKNSLVPKQEYQLKEKA